MIEGNLIAEINETHKAVIAAGESALRHSH
jgi:hypothetical protein